ncbi:MAG: hypothetical protein E7514_06300 [Ruminococcaceae bacterium]|nr:hypothetical protein [Oscillospiraceae bacterium]
MRIHINSSRFIIAELSSRDTADYGIDRMDASGIRRLARELTAYSKPPVTGNVRVAVECFTSADGSAFLAVRIMPRYLYRRKRALLSVSVEKADCLFGICEALKPKRQSIRSAVYCEVNGKKLVLIKGILDNNYLKTMLSEFGTAAAVSEIQSLVILEHSTVLTELTPLLWL